MSGGSDRGNQQKLRAAKRKPPVVALETGGGGGASGLPAVAAVATSPRILLQGLTPAAERALLNHAAQALRTQPPAAAAGEGDDSADGMDVDAAARRALAASAVTALRSWLQTDAVLDDGPKNSPTTPALVLAARSRGDAAAEALEEAMKAMEEEAEAALQALPASRVALHATILPALRCAFVQKKPNQSHTQSGMIDRPHSKPLSSAIFNRPREGWDDLKADFQML
jgi:hypothetical protein